MANDAPDATPDATSGAALATAPSTGTSAPPASGLDEAYLAQIRKLEGYSPRAYGDYKQFSIGYGTKANHPGEVIDRAEAERRLQAEIGKAASSVDQFAPGLDPGTRAGLTSLTYNAGPGWQQAGLGNAIQSGDMDTARQRFAAYNKAGGDVNDALVKRRAVELSWFGAPPPNGSPSDATTAGVTGSPAAGSRPGATSVAQASPANPGVGQGASSSDLAKALKSIFAPSTTSDGTTKDGSKSPFETIMANYNAGQQANAQRQADAGTSMQKSGDALAGLSATQRAQLAQLVQQIGAGGGHGLFNTGQLFTAASPQPQPQPQQQPYGAFGGTSNA